MGPFDPAPLTGFGVPHPTIPGTLLATFENMLVLFELTSGNDVVFSYTSTLDECSSRASRSTRTRSG
jgi:hypothetical protein